MSVFVLSSVDVAVIVALPTDTPVTSPVFVFTVAILLSLLVQLTDTEFEDSSSANSLVFFPLSTDAVDAVIFTDCGALF